MNMKRNTISIENARIGFRNFSGVGGQYNREGDRNFVVFLEREMADELVEMGLNVKELAPREEGDDSQPFLKVSVGFKSKYPPKIALVKQNRIEYLSQETINLLDWAEIENVDLIINPSTWEVNGNKGIKAWLKAIYVKIVEDEFESKYSDVMDSAKKCVGPDCQID